MKFRLIDAKKIRMPTARMCALLDVSVSGYHAWRRRGPSRRQLDDMVFLANIRTRLIGGLRPVHLPAVTAFAQAASTSSAEQVPPSHAHLRH